MFTVKSLTRIFGASPETPIHFLHMGKTGGSALISALKPIADSYGIVLHDHATRLSDIPRNERFFFFVRHPISRFVSGFYSRRRCGRPRYDYPWNEAEAKAFAFFPKPNDLAEALSASDREVELRAREAMHGVGHVKSHYTDWFLGERELEDRLYTLVFIGRQEKLNSDFEELKLLINLPAQLQLPQDEVLAHRNPAELDRGLSPLAKQNLSAWYADDILFYQRCLELRAELPAQSKNHLSVVD